MFIEMLEGRRMLSAAEPTDLEQYFVELTNRARANPNGEAKLFGMSLNEGLAAGTLNKNPRQPLAINPFLVSAARKYSKALLNPPRGKNTTPGQLNHQLNGTTPWGRAQAEGYPSMNVGENLAWVSQSGTKPTLASTEKNHELLFKDFTATFQYPGRGHRLQILNGTKKEIGIGLAVGMFGSRNAQVATQDFGIPASGVFLTGVAYTDAVKDDDFYTPGEGLGGVTVTAVNQAPGGQTFTATTWKSGGYSLSVAPGYYVVTASGGALGRTVEYRVTVGAENVKLDFLKTGGKDKTAPTAAYRPSGVVTPAPATGRYSIMVDYNDQIGLSGKSINSKDVEVTGPNGFKALAKLGAPVAGAPTSAAAVYGVAPPGGTWDASDNGKYTIRLVAEQVKDAAGNFVKAVKLGTFTISVPAAAAGFAVVAEQMNAAEGPSHERPLDLGDESDLLA